ncbi:MAG: hypothetical protein KDA51_14220 [Planctomycetales bacterium]|nr:hypothetical protein [Planctomycetales bacterium]
MIVDFDRCSKDLTYPTTLREVALIDAEASAAVGSVSLSWWYAEVAAGRAPKPAVQRPRHTRWLVADVVAFWRKFVEANAPDNEAAEATRAKAALASRKAQEPSAVAKARATKAENTARRAMNAAVSKTTEADHA